MRRGDLITVALQGDGGKPRPALVIQADGFAEIPTIAVLPLTSTILDSPLVRVTVEPTTANGLLKRSQVVVSRPQFLLRGKAGPVIGRVDDAILVSVGRLLALFLGLAG
ncbi:type II toxin-antitoxin system PemK/MazF family toxin [Rhodopila sp.]|jgi:mRNA interferase MazF|uniref:type II toxin-antitoxin system PemK/MazF family toxin n=1 Tax=Rhodopila sp. TaxID=2480087 RepID=UPI002BF82E2D|nr:type II toxin-antitoxin system PemK/MazF family toxin [Rhodopila sp.]HVZ06988.1 type II toxin-antitoxin system PemK/MazF family toxin [Rhodopila sp.]